MTTLRNGALGGALVGILGATAAIVVERYAPPGGRARPGDGGRRSWVLLAAGIAYGVLAGTLALAVELYAVGLLGVPPTALEAFGAALAWSTILLAAALGVQRLLAPDDSATRRLLVAYHVTFGVGLGLWIRLTWIT